MKQKIALIVFLMAVGVYATPDTKTQKQAEGCGGAKIVRELKEKTAPHRPKSACLAKLFLVLRVLANDGAVG